MDSEASDQTSTPASKSTYTQGHSAAVVASHASRTVENSAAFLLPHLKPHFTILDLGCGPGTITRGFCAHVPQGRVIGIDAGEAVIAQARSLASGSAYPNLFFQVGDITTRLPFEDGSVDVVYTSQTLFHVPYAVRVMKEAFRVLKAGGMLAMRESDTMIWHPSNPGIDQYQSLMVKIVPSGAQGFGTGRRLHIWAQEAGFERAKMQVGSGTFSYSAPEQSRWWAGTHIDRLRGEVGKKWLEEFKIVSEQAQIDQMIDGLRTWAESPDAWFAALQGEVICWK